MPASKQTTPQDDSSDPEVQFIKIQRPRHLKIHEDSRWPTDTHLDRPDSGKIRLNQQQRPVRRVAKEAIQNLFVSLLWVHAFPDAVLRSKFNREALYKAARDLKLDNIKHRIQSDIEYVDSLSAIVCGTFVPTHYTNTLLFFSQMLVLVTFARMLRMPHGAGSQPATRSTRKLHRLI